MADMILTTPESKTHVVDYDVVFDSGMFMPLTLQPDLGDTIDLSDPDVVVAYLSPKPSKTDSTKILPAEEISLFKTHIISIVRRERDIIAMTPEQQSEWTKTLHEMSGAVN